MTYLPKDIRDRLAESPQVVNRFSDRMYDEVIPQGGGFPCLVINVIDSRPEYYLGGEAGRHISQIQIDVWTDGIGGGNKLNECSELVRSRLSGYRGQFGNGCYGTSRLIGSPSNSSPPIDGSDQHRRRCSMNFEIIHSADLPALL